MTQTIPFPTGKRPKNPITITPVPQFVGRRQAYTIDFSAGNPITVVHSLNSELVTCSLMSTGPNSSEPTVDFIDNNQISFTMYDGGNPDGVFRVFIWLEQ